MSILGAIGILVLGTSILVLIITLMLSLKRESKLERICMELEEKLFEVQVDVEKTVGIMEELDYNGVFQSDDEVGAVFTALKEISQQLKTNTLDEKR